MAFASYVNVYSFYVVFSALGFVHITASDFKFLEFK